MLGRQRSQLEEKRQKEAEERQRALFLDVSDIAFFCVSGISGEIGQ